MWPLDWWGHPPCPFAQHLQLLPELRRTYYTTHYTYGWNFSRWIFLPKSCHFFQLQRLFLITFGIEPPPSIDFSSQSFQRQSVKLTSKSPMFRGSFRILNMRWRVQKLVLLTAADMIDQKNQLREVAQCQKYSKTAAEVEKKWQLLEKISVQGNVNHIENKNSSRTRIWALWALWIVHLVTWSGFRIHVACMVRMSVLPFDGFWEKDWK